MEGWIKLHRKLVDWEWYHDSKMVHLLFHLIAKANHKDRKWKGIDIKRGQLITGLDVLKQQTGISTQSLRTCLERLISTGEITNKSTNKYRVITILKYDSYQVNENDNNQTNKQLTNKQQTTNKQLTANKNVKNIKNEINKDKNEIFTKWLNYRKEIKKPVKVNSTINSLIEKFNSTSVSKCEWVVNQSIQNNYTGLFWDNYKESNNSSKSNFANPII